MAIVDNDFMAIYLTWLVEIGSRSGIHFTFDSYSLMFELISPLITQIGGELNVVYIFRLINALMLIVISLQLYLLMTVYVEKYVALCSIAILLLTTVMYTRGIDIRPDIFVLLIWLQIILMMCKEESLANCDRMFIVGFLYGMGFLFKAKALIITVPMLILFYGGCIHSGMNLSVAIRALLSLLLGCFVALAIFFLKANINGMDEIYSAGFTLISHSFNNDDEAGLKSVVLFNAIKADFGYWLFFIFGCYLVVRNYARYHTRQLLLFMAVVSLIILSVVINPHYYAYNLVSLYALMLLISAVYIKIPLDKSFFSSRKVRIISGLAITSYLMIKSFVGLVEVSKYTIDHQLSLNQFIEENLHGYRNVYTNGEISRITGPNVHWVAYRDGYKTNNIWRDIKSRKPILIIIDYKFMHELKGEDRVNLFEHYTYLTPQILTPGFGTESEVKGKLLLSGRYRLTNSENEVCKLNGTLYSPNSVIRLKRGVHLLQSFGGKCTLKYYFNEKSVNELIRSNPNMLPYLLDAN